VSDPTASASVGRAQARRALDRIQDLSSDLTGCALLDRDGALLAASGDGRTWRPAARALLAAADAAAGAAVTHAHVGTEDGEAFVVRHEGLVLIVASERFPLASLMFSDMRAVLRELLRGAPSAVPSSRAA
jgi:hypothetical protein